MVYGNEKQLAVQVNNWCEPSHLKWIRDDGSLVWKESRLYVRVWDFSREGTALDFAPKLWQAQGIKGGGEWGRGPREDARAYRNETEEGNAVGGQNETEGRRATQAVMGTSMKVRRPVWGTRLERPSHKPLLLQVWPQDQQHRHPRGVRNPPSQAPPRTCEAKSAF